MTKYSDILVPTDGSRGATRAAEHAFELAEEYDATVHVLYVIEPVYGTDSDNPEMIEALWGEFGEDVLEDLEADGQEAGLPVVTAVRSGVPHEVILEYVDENDVDLVVMGTHGRTGLDRFLLGSVTERVVRLSPVPVMTIRSPVDESGEE